MDFVAIDSHVSADGFVNTAMNDGGVGPVRFTLFADMTHGICQADDVGTPSGAVAFRGSFLIDQEGMVRHHVVNDLPLGRNVDEMLRMVDALTFHQSHGEVCPAGWKEGDKGMAASPKGVADYLAENADAL